jgi:transcriptional regulator GlxA family with amidase domain
MRFLVLLLVLLASCETSQQQIPKSGPVAKGQSLNAAFLIIDGVYNSELMAPYDIFQHTIFHTEGGIQVFTVSEKMDTIITFEGLKLLPDFSFDSQNMPDIDILVVPSAEHNMDADLENERLIEWVAKVGKKADFVMSLCDGAFVLAKAGLVAGKESTTFPSDIPTYRNMFPQLKVHEQVSFVHDGSLLTSVGGAKSYDAALYLVQHLYGEEVAKNVAKGLVIDWDLADYALILVE